MLFCCQKNSKNNKQIDDSFGVEIYSETLEEAHKNFKTTLIEGQSEFVPDGKLAVPPKDSGVELVKYPTKIGEIPATTDEFLQNENNSKLLKSVSSSGNRNWGQFFALAADKIQQKYGIPVLMKFELSGTSTEVENYIDYLENN